MTASPYSRYVIVQAGGKGSRLGHLTANRPKCLVPVDNRPMLFHLFKAFAGAKIIIIGDTHFDVLERYLKTWADADYILERATGHAGTLAGIAQALDHVPAGAPFTIIWSDLVLPEKVELPEDHARNWIVTSPGLPCRWSFTDGIIAETPSDTHGICGFFLISRKEIFGAVPQDGQLVKFFSGFQSDFSECVVPGIREFGLLEKYEALPRPKCRPFNRITEAGERMIKEALDSQGENLAKREKSWYRAAQRRGLPIPEIHSWDPLCMERLKGSTIAEIESPPVSEQRRILGQILEGLAKIHAVMEAEADGASFFEAYLHKTARRLEKIADLVPFMRDERIRINGKECRNFLYNMEPARRMLERHLPRRFCFIHGDCTFSNTFLDEQKGIVFIDPRGYFGHKELYGDRNYDYAKLYYSLYGNYDRFNQRRFRLAIKDGGAELAIESNGWTIPEEEFFAALPDVKPEAIRLLHSLIWLSLTTYAWEDYDAICGAFYNGARLFEEALNEHGV